MVTRRGIVAVVPARGGSKSIPRKNIRPLRGVPLVAYSIAAGLESRLVDRVIVSTDDEEIAEVAKRWGADVPFRRPAALAGDATPDLPVFRHALEWLATHEAWTPEVVVHLRPTSPIRPPGCVDAAVALLHADAAADSVRAVVPAGQTPYKMWRVLADGTMAPFAEHAVAEAFNQPRQLLPPVYWQTGHVDVVRASTILDKGSMTGSRILPYVLDGAYATDIDTEADWRRADWAMTQTTLPLISPTQSVVLGFLDIRLVVFDFDGVMTDNRVWVSEEGGEAVACNRSDGLGLAALRRTGLELLVLSTEVNPVVAARCRKLDLPFEQGIRDKRARLQRYLTERGIPAREVMYVGNDINDLGCMRLVGCGVAVADAHPDVLAEADLVLTRPGGHGAVRELCDRMVAAVSTGSGRP